MTHAEVEALLGGTNNTGIDYSRCKVHKFWDYSDGSTANVWYENGQVVEYETDRPEWYLATRSTARLWMRYLLVQTGVL